MKFAKCGLVYCPDGASPLMRAYAILPTPLLHEKDSAIRVYFGSVDDDTVGRVFFLDLDVENPTRVLNQPDKPVLVGCAADFDRHGVLPTSIVQQHNDLWLYYAGFHRQPPDIPYTLFTGLAVGSNGLFHRKGIVLPPSKDEPLFRTASFVLKERDRWRMWYIGGAEFFSYRDKQLPIYGLRYCESQDGLSWGLPRVLLDPDRSQGIIGFGRPFVLRDGKNYRLFLSVRTVDGYTISHAVSADGLQWSQWQHNIIPPSDSGWDSEMCAYAAPIIVRGQEYIFYNGNQYGRTGFGLAIREQ